MEPLVNNPQLIAKHPKPPSPAMTSESGQRAAAEKEEQLPCPCPCPRCHSTDTKFCYYNNYNLSQPRHLCKSCRRHWTRGGALRDVPVGGATRKTSSSNNNNNKRRRTTVANTTTNSIENNNSTNEVIICQSDQTRPVYPDSAACDESAWWGGQLGGLFPLNEYGLDLANGPMSVGGKVECEESFGCATWQMGGGVEGSMVEGDYFSWPELAMSTPPKALMK